MTIHAPVPDYAAARQAMVDSQLRPQGVTDAGVIDAMGSIAREQFVPAEVRPLAYADRTISLGDGRSLSSTTFLGQLLTQLAPAEGDRALVVGAATGYSSAVLKAIGLDVVALESSGELAAMAAAQGIEVVTGELAEGWAAGAPYDIVLIDGAVEYLPEAIIDQLADGGRLGAALLERGICRLIVGRKAGGAFGHLSVADAPAPQLPGFTKPTAFTF